MNPPDVDIDFDAARSRRYRKVTEVLAFQSGAAFVFHKDWGTQSLGRGSWVIVPLREGAPSDDLYGCADEEFRKTYRPSSSGRAHAYEKAAEIDAYRPGVAFAVRSVVGGVVEVERATGGPTDWLVRNPGGEVYVVPDAVFRASYREVTS